MLKINQLNKTNRCCLALHRFKSKKSEQNEYYKTLNLPNPGKFELEYNAEHKSSAVYVAFELVKYPDSIKQLLSKFYLIYY